MIEKYRVKLWEDKVEKNKEGQLTHHPLTSRYRFTDGTDFPSYGYLTFCGHDMDKSSLLKDVHVYYLEFSGESIGYREAWADQLRADALKRLSRDQFSWYLGVYIDDAHYISDILQRNQLIKDNPYSISSVTVDSERKYGYGLGFIQRVFFEIPWSKIETVLVNYWPDAVQGWTIEGYCMPPGQLNLFTDWNSRSRDDKLCKDVLNHVRIAFYTFPEENRHFVLLTNKLRYKELENYINLKELQKKAGELRLP